MTIASCQDARRCARSSASRVPILLAADRYRFIVYTHLRAGHAITGGVNKKGKESLLTDKARAEPTACVANVWIRAGFAQREPFIFEWHYILKRSPRAV
jgi:hypothetical protein